MFEEVFERKRPKPTSFISYGFKRVKDCWLYETNIKNDEFLLTVKIFESGNLETTLKENETGEDYFLYKTNSHGPYVTEIRTEIKQILQKIADVCYEPAAFKTRQSQVMINFVRDIYGDELEFLWAKFPGNAVWRRKDNAKWYGVILTVKRSKLGQDSDEIAEIIDLRYFPDKIKDLLKQKNYYPGWHMNKQSWYTVILDNTVPDEILFERIKESYALAVK